MEKLITFGKDGSMRLPVGYRFCPSDDDLVNFYLRKKAFAQPFSLEIIPEFDVYQSEPWGLPAGGKVFEEQKFFFHYTKGRVGGNLDKRAAGSGHWRAVGKAKEIVFSGTKKLIGKRNTLIFWEGKGSSVSKTTWVMHEYRLVSVSNPSQMSNWAVYRIFQEAAKKEKKGKGSNGEPSNKGEVERHEDIKPTVIDFTVVSGSDSGPPPPCSP